MMDMTSFIATTLWICACLLFLALLAFAVYLLYLQRQYYRIDDGEILPLTREGQEPLLETGKEYRAVTYNLGFGAYDPAFSFFMDQGFMADGSRTKGKYSRALSPEAARRNILSCIKVALAQKPDFALLQEVDLDAHRSHHVNQQSLIDEALGRAGGMGIRSWAVCFHSAWLCYPLTRPIGRIRECGLMTLSRYQVTEAVRMSLPVSNQFIQKFMDMDRCFAVHRLPVQMGGSPTCGEEGEGTAESPPAGRHLVLLNIHTSAYDKGGLIRRKQMDKLSAFLKAEYESGNWVVAGGDFNHALAGTIDHFPGQMKRPPWGQPFDETMVPKGFRMIVADNMWEVATCRDSSIPYRPGVNYRTVLDGFIVSDNVQGVSLNLDAGFLGSDHNPVLLRFSLL
jgi:endonuclease/exonuclease/phosphatase family metal-dependent hydrolase